MCLEWNALSLGLIWVWEKFFGLQEIQGEPSLWLEWKTRVGIVQIWYKTCFCRTSSYWKGKIGCVCVTAGLDEVLKHPAVPYFFPIRVKYIFRVSQTPQLPEVTFLVLCLVWEGISCYLMRFFSPQFKPLCLSQTEHFPPLSESLSDFFPSGFTGAFVLWGKLGCIFGTSEPHQKFL